MKYTICFEIYLLNRNYGCDIKKTLPQKMSISWGSAYFVVAYSEISSITNE